MKQHRSLVVNVALVIGLLGQIQNVSAPASASTLHIVQAQSATHGVEGPLSPLSSPIATPASQIVVSPGVTSTLGLPSPVLVPARTGGRVRGSRRATVDLAPGSIRTDTVVSVTEFEKDGLRTTDGFSPVDPIQITILPHIASFEAPVTLTLDLSGFLSSDLLKIGWRPMLYYLQLR